MFGEGDSLKIGGDRLDANPIRLERLTLCVRNRSHLERVTQLMRILFALKGGDSMKESHSLYRESS